MSYHKQIRLTDRDVKVLKFLGDFGWVREDLLKLYIGVGDGVMSNIKYRLIKHGYIEKFTALETGCHLKLSNIGAEFIAVKYVKNLKLSTMYHDDMVVRLAIELLHKGYTNIKAESEIKQEQVSENNIKALLNEISATELKKRTHQKIPDLIVGNIAYEVEITQKADFRLKNIVNFYIGSGFKEVHYYTKISIMKRIQEHSRNHPKFIYHIFVDDIEEALQDKSHVPVVTIPEDHHDVNQILNNKKDEFLERIMSNLKSDKE